MHTALIALVSGISLAVFCAPATAQQLPKSGTFTIHSGFKAVGETVQPAEGRVYGAGFFWGVAFNDKGAGPLYNRPAVCSDTLEMVGSALTAKGQCTWSDPDGDKIFNDYTGSIAPSSLFEGMNQLTGGRASTLGFKARPRCTAKCSGPTYCMHARRSSNINSHSPRWKRAPHGRTM